MMTRFEWQAVLALLIGSILLCFIISTAGGVDWA
jgi:hypothetical protein